VLRPYLFAAEGDDDQYASARLVPRGRFVLAAGRPAGAVPPAAQQAHRGLVRPLHVVQEDERRPPRGPESVQQGGERVERPGFPERLRPGVVGRRRHRWGPRSERLGQSGQGRRGRVQTLPDPAGQGGARRGRSPGQGGDPLDHPAEHLERALG
jgi:hypothetical protein